MKKISTLIFTLLAALLGVTAHASIYIVGDQFGGWDPGNGVEMTLEDGVYSYTDYIDGIVFFVFADGLDSDWTTFNANYRYGPANDDQIVNYDEWITTQKTNDNSVYMFQGFGYVYVFTFDETNKRFRIDHSFVEPPFSVFTVAGTSNIFGSNWDCTDDSNDMVKENNGLYTWTKNNIVLAAGTEFEFKIVEFHAWNQSWPQDNYYYKIEETGIYDIVITFNPSFNYEITCTATKTSDPEPIYGDLNGDGLVNIADLTSLIDCIIGHGQDLSYDFDEDGSVDIADVTALIDYILQGPHLILRPNSPN